MKHPAIIFSCSVLSLLLAPLLGILLQGCWEGWQQQDDDDTLLDDDDTSVDDDDTSVDDDDSSADDDDSTPPPPSCSDDVLEENDSIPTAAGLTLGTTGGLIACPEDSDYFAVSVPLEQQLIVSTAFAHAAGDIDVEVIAPDGGQFYGNSTDNNEEVITEASTGTGLFTIKVHLYSESDAVPGNNYSLTLSSQPFVGGDDDDDDDDDANCIGPPNVAASVSLMDGAQNPTTLLSVGDPLTINVELEHLSGSNWTSPYLNNCLFLFQLINPEYPGFSQTIGRLDCVGQRQCTDPSASPLSEGSACTLDCGAGPFTDSYTLAPTGFAPDRNGNYVALPSGNYELLVQLDPTSWLTGIPDQTFLVTIREGALDSECSDNDDNDGDGQLDCNDPDCAGVGPCP